MREDMKAGDVQSGQAEGKSTGAQKACAAFKELHKELHSQAGDSQ